MMSNTPAQPHGGAVCHLPTLTAHMSNHRVQTWVKFALPAATSPAAYYPTSGMRERSVPGFCSGQPSHLDIIDNPGKLDPQLLTIHAGACRR